MATSAAFTPVDRAAVHAFIENDLKTGRKTRYIGLPDSLPTEGSFWVFKDDADGDGVDGAVVTDASGRVVLLYTAAGYLGRQFWRKVVAHTAKDGVATFAVRFGFNDWFGPVARPTGGFVPFIRGALASNPIPGVTDIVLVTSTK